MDFNDFHDIIKKRSEINEEWYSEIENCRIEMTSLFSENIDKTVLFLDECSADEFSWLSEVFDSIAEKTHSKSFISALRKTAEKYSEETKKYNILEFIESAENIVNGLEN